MYYQCCATAAPSTKKKDRKSRVPLTGGASLFFFVASLFTQLLRQRKPNWLSDLFYIHYFFCINETHCTYGLKFQEEEMLEMGEGSLSMPPNYTFKFMSSSRGGDEVLQRVEVETSRGRGRAASLQLSTFDTETWTAQPS